MSKEGFLQDEENKKSLEKKKKLESKKVWEQSDIIEKKRQKKLQTEESLSKLKEMIRDGDMDISSLNFVKNIAEDGIIDSEEIKEIMLKIDDINNNPEVSRYLPDELRITRDEYLQALKNEKKKQLLLWKVEEALWHIGAQVSSGRKIGFNIFATMALILNRNLVLIQENHIDIKRSLI